ncbi:MAG: hypothetical protein ABW168_23600, partial [Sedimenticola sp.]
RISHYITALKQNLENKVKKVTKYKHVKPGPKRIQADECAVQSIAAGLHSWVPHLWLRDQPLVYISGNRKKCTGSNDQKLQQLQCIEENPHYQDPIKRHHEKSVNSGR